jgi:aminoglycoside phosphotransferase (APT) family kinase protein
VNASFTVTDGATTFHLKLALGPYEVGRLWRWFELRAPLAERYHAPPVVSWVALAGTHAEGLLFPHIDGLEPDLARDDLVLRGLIEAFDDLHADEELAAALGGEPRVALDSFAGTFITRFTSDLDEVTDAGSPPFVDADTWRWMRTETLRLIQLSAASTAFAEPVASVIHGDPWPANVIVTPDRWYLTDWDDVAIGDPALDLAILLWQPAKDGRPVEGFVGARDAAFRERFKLYARANLLDEVIDPLADWVEAAKAPEHRDEVRAAKEKVHRGALQEYRARYGT